MTFFMRDHGQRLLATIGAPTGSAKGIFPGRVVWVHIPKGGTSGAEGWTEAPFDGRGRLRIMEQQC